MTLREKLEEAMAECQDLVNLDEVGEEYLGVSEREQLELTAEALSTALRAVRRRLRRVSRVSKSV